MLIGYARVSTQEQDLAAQTEGLAALGVAPERIYTEKGSGRRPDRPVLDAALTALREGDVLVVTKLDRLSRSLVDSHRIAQRVAESGAALQIGSSVHDPSTPLGRFFFNVLATFAEFEADVASQRTKEGLAIAKAKGRMKGRAPRLSRRQHAKVLAEYESGEVTITELMEDYDVSRATVYRTLDRAREYRAQTATKESR